MTYFNNTSTRIDITQTLLLRAQCTRAINVNLFKNVNLFTQTNTQIEQLRMHYRSGTEERCCICMWQTLRFQSLSVTNLSTIVYKSYDVVSIDVKKRFFRFLF